MHDILVALVSAVFSFLATWLLTRGDKLDETRRAIERKLAVLLSPYTIDSIVTRNDLAKIQKDWTGAIAEYKPTVNGALVDISIHINHYFETVRLYMNEEIPRSELEDKRQLAAEFAFARVPSIRRRR